MTQFQKFDGANGPTDYLQQIRDMMGAPSLLPGEDPAAYEKLRESLWLDLQPNDFVSAMHVQDVVDNWWDDWRLRRVKPGIIRAAHLSAINALFQSAYGDFGAGNELAQSETISYATDKDGSRNRALAILKQFGYTEADIRAKAFECSLSKILVLERLQESGAKRCAATLRDYERRKERRKAAAVSNWDEPYGIEVGGD